MIGRQKATLAALVAAVLALVGFTLGSSVTNASPGMSTGTTRHGDVVTSGTVIQTIDPTQLVLSSSGTTTKTLIKGSCSVANLKTWWSEYVGGSTPYLEYKNTSWNAPGSCGDPYGNFQLQFISNNGNQSGWFTQSDGETIPQDLDTRGTATSKVKLGYPCPTGPNWGYHTIVTAPWGTDQILAPC